MTRDEFVNACINGGYCSRKIANRYCEGKDNLTDDDFIEVYRIRTKELTAKEIAIKNEKYHRVEGVKTTKVYSHKDC